MASCAERKLIKGRVEGLKKFYMHLRDFAGGHEIGRELCRRASLHRQKLRKYKKIYFRYITPEPGR